jgi:hypothetical protein
LYPLGFLDKYVTVSQRQVKAITASQDRVIFDLELPAGTSYTFAVVVEGGITAQGPGISQVALERQAELTLVRFRVDTEQCRLVIEL